MIYYDILWLWPLIGIQYVMSQSFTFLWLKPLQMIFLFLFWQQRGSFCRPYYTVCWLMLVDTKKWQCHPIPQIPPDSALGCCLKKSSLHYTSFIVSSYVIMIWNYSSWENWWKLRWSLLRIHFNWYGPLGLCNSAISTADASTPTLVILTNDATVRLNPSCFDGSMSSDSERVADVAKYMVVVTKPMFKVSQCPLNHYRSSIFSLHTTRSKHLPSIRCSPALRHRCGTHRGCRVQGIQRGCDRLWPDWIW